jgi:hypothetical protein
MGDNINMDFEEIVWESVDSIHLAQDRIQWQILEYMVMKLQLQ